MKKILITGVSGFVGGYFVHHIASHYDTIEIHGISRSIPAWDFVNVSSELFNDHHFHIADLNDIPKLKSLIEKIQPDYILHLAAQSSVAESWVSPVDSFMNNTNIFLNIIDTVRLNDNAARILSVGSSEQYGIVSEADLPLKEESPQHPANPYAVARVAQEQLARIYAEGYGIDICCTRSFNHCGPGQSDRFVVSSIVKQFVQIVHGTREPTIHIGDGAIIRDFIDVRDVVQAYNLLLTKGKRGDVYNVCSGQGRSIEEIIFILSDILDIHVKISQEKDQIRPIDNPRIIGNNEKIARELKWSPGISFESTLKSMFTFWERRLNYPTCLHLEER
jgi:GDP-4-dehydro-6-deoxy-D-mannose reductase